MRIRVKVTALTLAGFALIVLSGCGTAVESAINIPTAKAVTITNSQVPQVKRVIALANGSAEIISALGLKDLLVGRDIASTDADLSKVPVVTSGHQVIPEKIISLNPDLVIIDKSTGPQRAIDALRSAGIQVVETPEAWTLTDIEPKVAAIAAALGVAQDGAKLNEELAAAAAPDLNLKPGTRVAFLYLRGSSAIYLIGGKGSGADSLLQATGAVDVGAQKLTNPFTAMTSEAIASLNPEVFLVMTKGLESTGGVAGLIALPGIAQTDAGKKKRVISVDDSLLLSFGPRTPDLLQQLQVAIDKVMKK
jgi:iron complex transport system substrate-binding protein